MPSLWKHLRTEWFYSRSAAVLFVTSAAIVVAGVAVSEFFPNAFSNASSYSTPKEVTFTAAMMLWAISNLIIVVGMFRFWIVEDKSRPAARKVWFAIMLLGFVRLGLGAALYCFIRYLPQVTKRTMEGSDLQSVDT